MSADTPSTDPVPEETIVVSDTPVGHSGTNVDVMEKPAWTMGPGAAIAAVLISLALIVGSVVAVIAKAAQEDAKQLGLTLIGLGILGVVMGTLVAGMIKVNSPGHTQVIQLFGRYLGTNRRTGLSLVPPLTNAKKVSVRVRNFETNEIKVNDLNGNPVVIGAIVVWQVADTAKATFAVEDMEEFIHSQSESALRHVATTHPYDSTDIDTIPSLSGSTDLVSQELADEVAARVAVAGLEIVETRISALSYAPEIAQAMLQRQQATAIVDARETIVEGAVTMVESALDKLDERDIVDLDSERRASMVSNLLVVLCSDSSTQPVVNTGSLYT
ncbi:SPFH domain-containing protein [Corynebacterium durum]|jgi:SPFH/band 7/PHB domain protein|uniref:SPFH domain-containing protein n=1 Tax=Corynebacterium durum TaxID=61592 RepID=UPI0036F1B119